MATTAKTYGLFDTIFYPPVFIAIFSYILALGYLLYTACPLIFAIFIAIPLTLIIGLPIMLVTSIYLLLADIFVSIKYDIKFYQKNKKSNQQIDPSVYQ